MSFIPLAERLRPNKLEDFIGQDHLIGNNGRLLNSLKTKLYPLLFFGALLVLEKQH